MSDFPVDHLRSQFPALQRRVENTAPIFLDGPGGTQVPRRVIEAIGHYLATCNANHGGAFLTSQESDAVVERAHAAVARMLNAPSPREVIFGQNMTSLTFHFSRALARTWRPRDEILVTRLDHDANVRPWILAARDVGASVQFIDIRPEDCTLDLDDLRRKLTPRVKLLAVTAASNVVGTVNDIAMLVRLAHGVGAKVYVDAVHYAPHGLIDVRAWDCDFLACSAYKFFGPHVGILWGKTRWLEELEPYKVKPCSDSIPDRWMTGTQNHEGLAGVAAAVEYLEEIGRGDIRLAMTAIRTWEQSLGQRLLEGLLRRPHIKIHGIRDQGRLAERVPTFSLSVEGFYPAFLAQHLGRRHVYAWNGNMYALELSERLGLEREGGFLRLGVVHYNTPDEVDRTLKALDELS